MAYKRILTMQDISCVGQCSLTVALPVLCACGLEACALPTELLSTHTGGFQKPMIHHLWPILPGVREHWQSAGIRFDALYTGYLGSCQAVDAALEIADTLLDGPLIVDPAVADHGKLYSGLDEPYVQSIAKLCRRADILLPNLTEAALLTGMPYKMEKDLDYARRLGEALPAPTVILTGVGAEPGQTGVLYRHAGRWQHFAQPELEGRYSGTGDLFAACFTGALMQEKPLPQAVQIAAELTALCIQNTKQNPAHAYGIRFESILPELIQRLGSQ